MERLLASGQLSKLKEEEFVFMPSTNGLGSKTKGMPKQQPAQSQGKTNSNVNQLDQIFLCEIFKMNSSKQGLIQELSKNVDSSNVFEFLRLAANDSSNKETQHEAYWMVVYIFLKRTCGIDIASSFSKKSIKMLKGINMLEYTFADGKLIYKNILKKEAESVSK